MIFVTLGTQNFKMDRVTTKLSEMITNSEINQEVIVQHGYSDPVLNAVCYSMMASDKFENYLSKADVVICHGGTSSIIKSLNYGKKTIVIPRLFEYKEHVDDHQLEIVEVFEAAGLITVVNKIDELPTVLKKTMQKESLSKNQINFSGELKKHIRDSILEGI